MNRYNEYKTYNRLTFLTSYESVKTERSWKGLQKKYYGDIKYDNFITSREYYYLHDAIELPLFYNRKSYPIRKVWINLKKYINCSYRVFPSIKTKKSLYKYWGLSPYKRNGKYLKRYKPLWIFRRKKFLKKKPPEVITWSYIRGIYSLQTHLDIRLSRYDYRECAYRRKHNFIYFP
tara:strand:- start:40 stop:567 length:528 start_codon:yes stop_codon:yes gene_type:complete